jgi:hypothetical protein
MKIVFTALLAVAAVPAVQAQTVQTESSTADVMTLDPAEALALDAVQYAASYGVSIDEAMRRLLVMHDFDSEISAAKSSEGEDYAGSYFDNSTQFALVIRTTKAERIDRKLVRTAARAGLVADRKVENRRMRREQRRAIRSRLKLGDAVVETAEDIIASDVTLQVKYGVSAKRSLRQARIDLQSNQAALAKIPGLIQAFVDEKTGEIVIFIDNADKDVRSAEVASILSVPYRMESMPGGFQFTAARGGQSLLLGGTRDCTSGFVATRTRDMVKGIVTAGHCNASTYTIKDSTGTNIVLTLDTATQKNPQLFPSVNLDLAFYAAGPADQTKLVGEFFADSVVSRKVTATATKALTTASNGDENGLKGTTVGSYICHLGQTAPGSTGYFQSCGEVVSKTGTPLSGSTATGNFVIVRNTQTGKGTVRTTGNGTLSCFPGDSGGPWFANTTAYGIQSACGWVGPDSTYPTTYVAYTSVEDFTALGLTIVK